MLSKTFLFILVVIIVFFAFPLIIYTGILNSQLSLPESMSGLEEFIQQLEKEAEKTTKDLLNVSSSSGIILNIFIVAVIPAVSEELFFRGTLLNLLNDWTKNIHVAILISAFVFSFIHFQFYGLFCSENG